MRDDEVRMSFSGIVGGENNRHIEVSFSQGEKYAEGRIPPCTVAKNRGFTEKEVESLEDYLFRNKDEIWRRAKKINPMRAFLGE